MFSLARRKRVGFVFEWKEASNGPESVEMMPAKLAVDASYRPIGADDAERAVPSHCLISDRSKSTF